MTTTQISPIVKMEAAQYNTDGHRLVVHTCDRPSWANVENSVLRLNNHEFPYVNLYSLSLDPDDALVVMGGGQVGYALFSEMGEWQYVDENGSDMEVRLWTSDQGYYCQQKNIITSKEDVLKEIRYFYETGSFKVV